MPHVFATQGGPQNLTCRLVVQTVEKILETVNQIKLRYDQIYGEHLFELSAHGIQTPTQPTRQ